MTTSDSRFVQASKLAQFFRRNGDKIINGSCKLSLTTSALCLLNSLFFDTLHQDIHTDIGFPNASASEIQEDVKYLYNFMKRTSSLKLFHGMQTLRGGVDLSHFSNLTVLELRKIPAHLIIGLNNLSVQLKALICSRSIYLLKELFGSAADEQNTTDVWTELKELNLSYNYLESLDCSIRSIPHVEILDLSHNNLKNTDEIQVLKRLCCVNLSYNQLESLPTFSSLSCRHLSKLYVRNNNLENLDGLECLFNLEEFDAGFNLLSEYSVLSPLDKLKSLKVLNLEGNPLYFHSHHLRLLCNYLNPFALNRGLRLNGRFIAIPQNLVLHNDKNEESNAGSHQTSINTVVGDMHIHPPDIKSHLSKYASPLECIPSDKSVEENSASSYTSQNSIEQALVTGTKPKKKQRKSKSSKGRVVVIHEPEKEGDENKLPEKGNNGSGIPSHIIVKELYQARREKCGESWLIPDNPFTKFGSDLIAPSNTPETKPGVIVASNNTHNLPSNKVINDKILQECQEVENVSPSPVIKELKEVLDIQTDKTSDTETERRRHISNQSDDIEVLASNLQNFSNAKISSAEDLSDCDFYRSSDLGYSTADANVDDVLSDSEEESEDSIVFVEKVDKTQKRIVSLKIGAKCVKEKDAVTGELIDKLDLTSLLSVKNNIQEKDGIKSFEVLLEFDTVNTTRRQRLYIFPDLASAERICKILQPFADASTLKEATIGALECLNCKSQFSKQVAHRKVLKTKKPLYGKDVAPSTYNSSKEFVQEADACPNCNHHILVELESMPLPSIAAPPRPVENTVNVTHSPGSSSVGSSSSSGFLFSNLLNSFKISPAPKRKTFAGPLNDSVDGGPSKTSEAIGIYQSEKDYLKHRGSDSQISRNSSDVTIISNPSQSSIAVIPEPGIESNLNTIVERDSQSSISPPVSQSGTIYSNGKDHKNEDKQNGGGSVLSSKDDPDFYSLTESFIGEKEKPPKSSDMMSNDSDVFHSPYKSVGSSNLQTSKETDDCDKLMDILGEKKIVTYDSFKQLDHRLKLHIEISILSKDEYISSCLETSIVPLSTGEEFDGVFLLSSKNVYVMKFLSHYTVALEKHESLEKQVQVLYSGPLSQVKQIKILLGNQGICVGCGPPAHVYTLVIRDVDVCNSFCNLISEKIHEKNSQFEFLTSAEEMLQNLYESVLTAESEEKPEILLHQFAFKKDKDIVLPVSVTLTKEDIYLSKVLYKKLQSCSDLAKVQVYFFTNSDHQKISDIISLTLEENFTTVEVCFLIESSDVETKSWTIEMQTKSAMFSFISAVKLPWEEIFAVPLPLSLNKND